jgi:hypothetical protein
VRLLEIAVEEVYRKFAGRPTSGPDGMAPVAAFDFTVRRTSRDLREHDIRTQLGSGKAAINCRTRKLFLWAQSWVGPHRMS